MFSRLWKSKGGSLWVFPGNEGWAREESRVVGTKLRVDTTVVTISCCCSASHNFMEEGG